MNFKKLFASACVSASIFSGFAFDWGGLIRSDSKSKTNENHDFFLNQTNTASLWIRVPTGKDSPNYFIAETTYQFEDDFNTSTTRNCLDLNLFKAVFAKEEKNDRYEFNIGRFITADLTGIIFYQNADGISLKYTGPKVSVSAYGAYTGFLNGNAVKMINAADYSGCDPDRLYDFADKYVVGSVGISAPNLFANQTLSAQAFGTFRTTKTRLNRIYGSLELTGPIASLVFYKLCSTLGLTYWDDKSPKIGNLTTASLTVFPSKYISLSSNCVFASEDFWGFTHNPALLAYNEPEYHNLLKAGMSTTFKPNNSFMLLVSFDGAFDIGENDDTEITNRGNDTHPGDSRAGLQYKIGATWQPFTDMALSANFSQYYDLNETDISKTVIQIQVTLTF